MTALQLHDSCPTTDVLGSITSPQMPRINGLDLYHSCSEHALIGDMKHAKSDVVAMARLCLCTILRFHQAAACQIQMERCSSPCVHDAGEVSFHSGWTFHQAAGNATDAPREVFTIILMDKDMLMAEPINHNQHLDHDRCAPLSNASLALHHPVGSCCGAF